MCHKNNWYTLLYFQQSYRLAIRTEGMVEDLVKNLNSQTDELQMHCASAIFKVRIHFCPLLSRKRGDIKSHSSVHPSVRNKNFNLGHYFCAITGRALILGMCVLCDKTFPMVPCCDLQGDLWHTSRSNLLPSGGPQFSEFALYLNVYYTCNYRASFKAVIDWKKRNTVIVLKAL